MEYKIGQTVYMRTAIDEVGVRKCFGDYVVPLCFVITAIVRTETEGGVYTSYHVRNSKFEVENVSTCELISSDLYLKYLQENRS